MKILKNHTVVMPKADQEIEITKFFNPEIKAWAIKTTVYTTDCGKIIGWGRDKRYRMFASLFQFVMLNKEPEVTVILSPTQIEWNPKNYIVPTKNFTFAKWPFFWWFAKFVFDYVILFFTIFFITLAIQSILKK